MEKGSGWEQIGAWGLPVSEGTDTEQCRPRSRELVPLSQPAPRQRARARLPSWGPRGARSARHSSQVTQASNPNDITKCHPPSYPSNLASAPKFRFLHIPHWHHLVYNLGPRIWANLEATKGEALTPGLLLLRDQPPRGGFPVDPNHVAPQGPASGGVRQRPLTR